MSPDPAPTDPPTNDPRQPLHRRRWRWWQQRQATVAPMPTWPGCPRPSSHRPSRPATGLRAPRTAVVAPALTTVLAAGLIMVTGVIAMAQPTPVGNGGTVGDGASTEVTTTELPDQGGGGTLAPVDPAITEQTEVYRTVDGQDLVVEVHRPADTDGTRPAVVLIHGGGWYSGEPSDMDPWADLAADAGWVAFSLQYRLATQGGGGPAWPEAFDDVQAGVEWVHDNAGRFGADPAKLAVFGESAGAHLTVLLAMEGTGGEARIAAATAWSPPLDLAPLSPIDGSVPGCTDNPQCREFWSLGVVDWFLGCPPASCASAYGAASPLGQVGRDTAPLWFANSTEELVPLPPAQQLDQELAAAGVDHHLQVVPGQAHAHGYGEAVWNDMVPWLATQLGVATPAPAPFPGSSGDQARTLAVAVGAGLLVLVAAGLLAARHERHRTAES